MRPWEETWINVGRMVLRGEERIATCKDDENARLAAQAPRMASLLGRMLNAVADDGTWACPFPQEVEDVLRDAGVNT